MFAKFFKPKWQHSNAEVRIRAIHRMNAGSTEDQEILSRLALQDQSTSVRRAAVELIVAPDILHKLHNEDVDHQVRRAAADRICKIILEQCDSTVEQNLTNLNQLTDDNLLTHIILHSPHSEIQNAALNRLTDQHCLCTISIDGATSQLRQTAAKQLLQEEYLEQVAKAARSKDKSVFRIVRTKLQQLQEQKRLTELKIQRCMELLDSLRHLSDTEYYPQYTAKFEALCNEWDKIEVQHSTETLQTFTGLTQQCLDIISEQKQLIEAEQSRLEQQQIRQAELQQSFKSMRLLLAEMAEQMHTELFSTPSLEQFQNRWSEQLQQLNNLSCNKSKEHTQLQITLEQQFTALNNGAANYLQSKTQLAELNSEISEPAQAKTLHQKIKQIEECIKQIQWPSSVDLPLPLQQLLLIQNSLKQQLATLSQQSQTHYSELTGLLDSLSAAIEQGETREAIKLEKKATSTLSELNGSTPKQLLQQHKSLHAKLTALKDWQGYAITPKKEQLCDSMEGLIGSTLPAPELARKINKLQQEWKQLDASDPFHSRTLWQRFKNASDTAYEPCSQHFADQKKLRKDNLIKRQQLVNQLQQFFDITDWDHPDWDQVELISRTAKLEWKQYAPVDRTPGKPVQSQFNKLLKELDGQIKRYREQNAVLKQELLKHAEELAASDDLNSAAEQIKKLQQQWKQSGCTFHSVERKLWPLFRQSCNSVFEQLNQQKQTERNSNQQHQTQLKYKLQQSELKNLLESDQFQALTRRISLCDQLESLILNGTLDQLALDEIQQAWEKGNQPNSDFEPLINDRFELLLELVAGRLEMEQLLNLTEDKLRQLCIRLEISLGLESPEQDQALRMEYQMHRLQQALAQHDNAPSMHDLKILETEWNCVALNQLHTELTQRFKNNLSSVSY